MFVIKFFYEVLLCTHSRHSASVAYIKVSRLHPQTPGQYLDAFVIIIVNVIIICVFYSHLHQRLMLILLGFSLQLLNLNFLHSVDQSTRTMPVNSTESSRLQVLRYLVDSLSRFLPKPAFSMLVSGCHCSVFCFFGVALVYCFVFYW